MPSFPAFFQQWADEVEWDVPDFHLEVCDWLPRRGRVALLKMFRGAAKSSILGRYVPWKLKEDPKWRFLNMSATDGDAAKLSADARFVIQQHPWCSGMRQSGNLWKVHSFMVAGANDMRNPSVSAAGIMSNITGGRADEALFDDVEVPKTIATATLREGLRAKLSEVTHILVPGGKKLYVGTDHCHDSIYKEIQSKGADSLIIPLFRLEQSIVATGLTDKFPIPWRVSKDTDLFIMTGGRILEPTEYECHSLKNYKGGYVRFKSIPPRDTQIIFYAGSAWPKRFSREEIAGRRLECRTQNEWDSQYQLQAKPIGEYRLNPDRMIPYTATPEIRQVNGETICWLNGVRLVGVSTYWDCSLGKKDSDASALVVIYSDSSGYLYWHVARALTGEIDEQCQQVVKIVRELKLPKVCVETNGPGGFVPKILQRHLFTAGIRCSVEPRWSKTNKNLRILDGLETPLSGMFLHASPEVIQTVSNQMRDWNPATQNQPDDFLDAGAGAISEQPVRIGYVSEEMRDAAVSPASWRSNGGVHELQADY